MAININDYLEQAGFGESALIHTNKRRRVRPKKPSMLAWSESASYIRLDKYRNALNVMNTRIEIAKLQARGEGLDDIKDKLKSGTKKIKKFLVDLYEKCIRFFTETVRYWMSNEKKAAKVKAKLKAAIGKVNATDTIENYVKENSKQDKLKGVLKNTTGNTDHTVESITNKVFNDIDGITGNDASDVNDKASELKQEIKDKYDEAIKEVQEYYNASNAEKSGATGANVTSKANSCLNYLTANTSKATTGMRAFNSQIRKLQEEKKKLIKDFKETKDKTEEGGKEHQMKRSKLSAKISLASAYKGYSDKLTGVLLKWAAYEIAACGRCKKAKSEAAGKTKKEGE